MSNSNAADDGHVVLHASSSKRIPGVRKTLARMAVGSMVLFCLVGFLLLVTDTSSHLFLRNDAEYGDSYILYDVLHFQQSGVIYRDLSQPPYLPAQYSPLVYILYSLPGRIESWQNAFLGPRLIALALFLGCIAITASIARALIPARAAWLWAILLACSIDAMRFWVLQLRGDLGGILLNLIAIRLLMMRSHRAVLLAGVCAGLAPHFKFTLVAGLAAGALWLLFRRQWKDLATFVAAGTFTSIGLYLLFWVWQPRMAAQIFALSPGIPDVLGCLKLIYHALTEPVVLLAVLALPWAISRIMPRWGLLFVFAAISFAIGALTDIQAGGNVNYFYESLFALLPLAVLGVFRAMNWARHSTAAAMFMIALVALHLLPATARDLYAGIQESAPDKIRAQNLAYTTVQNVLRGQHIFSTVPPLALWDPAPALMEPYLLSYMQRLGKFDPKPILDRIRSDEFDVVITGHMTTWRGIAFLPKDVRDAIASSYKPHCAVLGTVIHLPRNHRANDILTQELQRIGCTPVSDADTSW